MTLYVILSCCTRFLEHCANRCDRSASTWE